MGAIFTLAQRLRIPLAALAILAGAGLVAVVLGGVVDSRKIALWFVAMAGVGIAVSGLALLRGTYGFAAATLALFLGGAAQLYVTEPLWYNELILPPRSAFEVLMYGLVAAQGLGAVILLWPFARTGAALRVVQTFGAVRLGLFFLLTAAFTVSILNYLRLDILSHYGLQLGANGIVLLINLLTAAALLAHIPAGSRLPDRLFAPGLLALFTLAASACVAWFAFERVGHVDDEISYIFQAQTYAGGAFWVPSLPEAAQPAFEHFQLMNDAGRWFSPLAPGWPAVLTLGVLAGAPWLVNPVLGALSVLLACGILSRIAPPAVARLGGLLFATSPWLIGMSASFMTHSLTLFLALLAWWCLVRIDPATGRGRVALALGAGLAMGWVFLTRPLDGIGIGGITGVMLVLGIGFHRDIRSIIAYGTGCALTGGLVFAYNAAIMGDPLKPPMEAYFDGTWVKEGFANRLGFGPEIGPPGGFSHMELVTPGHSPYEALINTLNNINSLQVEMFGWGIGSLAFIWALLIWGRTARWDRAMGVIFGAVVLTYVFYWFAGSFYIGPRYWFLALLPLVFLTARGVETVSARLQAAGLDPDGRKLATFVGMLCLYAAAVALTFHSVTRYHHGRNFHGHYRDIDVTVPAGEPAPLVLVKRDGHIGGAYFLNDPFMRPDRPVFAKDLGPETNAAVIAAFPGRAVIYVDGDTLGRD